MQYSLYGLRIRSEAAIPGLIEESDCEPTDLKIHFGNMPYRYERSGWVEIKNINTPFVADVDEPALIVEILSDGVCYKFTYRDRTTFVIDSKGAEIWVTWVSPMTLEDAATYLLGPVMGFVLRLRGVICLHASAIVLNGGAIVLAGPAGAGKSTTAAAFAQNGYAVISEDVVPIKSDENCFFVEPGYPLIRLWPESVEALYQTSNALPLLTPNWDKRYLGLFDHGYKFHSAAIPLSAIYLLNARSDHSSAPCLVPLDGRAALVRLIANSYSYYLLDRKMRAKEFHLFGGLASSVPIVEVTPSTDPSRLPELLSLITDHNNSTI